MLKIKQIKENKLVEGFIVIFELNLSATEIYFQVSIEIFRMLLFWMVLEFLRF